MARMQLTPEGKQEAVADCDYLRRLRWSQGVPDASAGGRYLVRLFRARATNTSTVMIERDQLMAKAAAWMQARGWKAKLAKNREYVPQR